MSTSTQTSRRSFVRSLAAGAALPYLVPASVFGANDKIGVALVGCGGMGLANLAACAKDPAAAVTGLCDVQKSRLERAAAQYPAARACHDYRELLADSAVDAVIVATPPHWHALIAIDSCRAGKDIYVQKPMTLHVAEALALRNAVRKHGRISQIGTQIHAGENYRRVVEYIQSGKLGPISVARTFNVMNQGPDGIGNPPNTDPPADIEWNLWVGPAPMRPYNPLAVKSATENCSFMSFSGGWTPGMAPHIIDLPVWALGLDYPHTTFCSGGRYVLKDAGDAPDSQEVLWQYPNFTMTWMTCLVNSFGFDFGRGSPARRLGVYFHGLNATLYSNYSMHEIVPEGPMLKDPAPPARSIAPSPGHELEWLGCIRTRRQPSCNVDYHCRIDIPVSLANLSIRLNRAIHFDPAAEKIVGDGEAAKLATPEYRQPWRFPAEYL